MNKTKGKKYLIFSLLALLLLILVYWYLNFNSAPYDLSIVILNSSLNLKVLLVNALLLLFAYLFLKAIFFLFNKYVFFITVIILVGLFFLMGNRVSAMLDHLFASLSNCELIELEEDFSRDCRVAYYRGQVIAGSHGPSFRTTYLVNKHQLIIEDKNNTYKIVSDPWMPEIDLMFRTGPTETIEATKK